MKTTKLLSLILLILQTTYSSGQGPQWDSIRIHASAVVNPSLSAQYGTPFVLNNANNGWTDGLWMSRDGLHLYSFYQPVDLPLLSNYINSVCGLDPCAANCTDKSKFFRGPFIGCDTMPTGAPCVPWLHSDIVYATRSSVNMPWGAWTNSNISNPIYYEGAPIGVENGAGLELFAYTQAHQSVDIMLLRNVSHNPNGGNPTDTAVGITDTAWAEDNPHIEKLNPSTFLMFMDDHASALNGADIWYSMSTDTGKTWLPKQKLTSVNSSLEDLQPHTWFDGADWWLYFASVDTQDYKITIYRSKFLDLPSKIDSLGPREWVIKPGPITWPNAEGFAVGEPTLSQWGDISFVMGYTDSTTANKTYDRFDLDPWFLPRIGSPMSILGAEPVRIAEARAYPSPANGYIIVEFLNLENSAHTFEVFDLNGMLVYRQEGVTSGRISITTDKLSAGTYIYRITSQNKKLKGGGRLVISQ